MNHESHGSNQIRHFCNRVILAWTAEQDLDLLNTGKGILLVPSEQNTAIYMNRLIQSPVFDLSRANIKVHIPSSVLY